MKAVYRHIIVFTVWLTMMMPGIMLSIATDDSVKYNRPDTVSFSNTTYDCPLLECTCKVCDDRYNECFTNTGNQFCCVTNVDSSCGSSEYPKQCEAVSMKTCYTVHIEYTVDIDAILKDDTVEGSLTTDCGDASCMDREVDRWNSGYYWILTYNFLDTPVNEVYAYGQTITDTPKPADPDNDNSVNYMVGAIMSMALGIFIACFTAAWTDDALKKYCGENNEDVVNTVNTVNTRAGNVDNQRGADRPHAVMELLRRDNQV